jgi:hypothetical protein
LHIRNEILIEVAKSDWLKKACKTVTPIHYDDLSQHILLILCEMNEEKLIKLYNDGYLKLYCIKIMWKQSTSPRQIFYQQVQSCGMYDVQDMEIEFIDNIRDAIDKEKMLTIVDNVILSNHWYEREIFNRWAGGESARSIHRKTKITLREILKVIKKVKEQILKEYE